MKKNEENNVVIPVASIPAKFNKGDVFSIETTNVAYLTHNFFKYPCKFIPQIPSWAIDTHPAEKGSKQSVYDPFMGSGTSLVEASIRGYDYYGSDIDPLSKLLSAVKSNRYSKRDLSIIERSVSTLTKNLEKSKKTLIPDIPNINHWFTDKNIDSLGRLRYLIDSVSDKKARDFMLICFASIIRKSSLADEMSPKPYISSRFTKPEEDPIRLFEKRCIDYHKRLVEFSEVSRGTKKYIGSDARKSSIGDSRIDIAVTSPPYINAFDYVRTLKLENLWLGLIDDASLKDLRENNVGTENISIKAQIESVDNPTLQKSIISIRKKDKKRALVVEKYFLDMSENISDVFRVLKPGGRYTIVVADSMIRDVYVPTRDVLIGLAENAGFKLITYFGYVIKNRYLRIPRNGQGGFMKIDWVIVLEKSKSDEA